MFSIVSIIVNALEKRKLCAKGSNFPCSLFTKQVKLKSPVMIMSDIPVSIAKCSESSMLL